MDSCLSLVAFATQSPPMTRVAEHATNGSLAAQCFALLAAGSSMFPPSLPAKRTLKLSQLMPVTHSTQTPPL
eukprot:165914-Amphidinium_carterae.1